MTVPAPIVEWAPDKGPYETVDTYIGVDGSAGTYVSTPDAAGYTFAGTYRVMVRVRATDWTAAATQQLVTHGSSGNLGWRLSVTTAGALLWGRSTDGTTEVTQTSSAPSLVDNTVYWLGVEYVTATGAVTFYRAADSQAMPAVWSGWTQVSTHTMTSGTPAGSTAALVVGADGAFANRLTGRIYEARLYSGSTLVAWLQPDLDADRSATSFVASTGETWTLAGAAAYTSDWDDITDYVQEGSVQTGRQYEVDRFNAGTAALTLVATTRLFDPDNTSGTYYGKLVPMRQFRIRMTRSSTTYPVFRGYVTDWGQVVPAADRAVYTTVQLADAFALLDATLAPSAYEQATLAKSPNVYFRFDDSNRLTDSSGNDRHGTFSATPTLVGSLLTNDPGSAWAANGTSRALGTHSVSFLTVASQYEFWFTTTATSGVILQIRNDNIVAFVMLRSGKLRFWSSGAGGFWETSAAVNDGQRHYAKFDFNTSDWVIDGSAVATTTGVEFSPAELSGAGFGISNGELLIGNNSGGQFPFVGTLDELAIYGAGTVASSFTVGTTPWSGQTTGARVGAILDAIDWPAGLRDIDTGDSTMQAFDAAGQSALQAIQQAADTELGQTHVDAYGRVHHRARQALWLDGRSRNSQQTFGDVHSGEAVRYVAEGFSLTRDETLLRNPVSASRQGGTTITVADSAGITKYGNRAYAAPTSYDSSDNVINDRATFLLGRYKELTTRLEAMTVHVHANPSALTPVVGRRQIGDRITVKRTPLGTGNEVVSELIIEGVAHRFAPEFWSTTYRASPVETGVFLILNDATYGQLDQEALGY